MSIVAIRPALAADLPHIAAIYADAVINGTASYELDPPDLAEMTARFNSLTRGDYPYVVAEHAGMVLGFAYAGPFRPRPAYRFIVEDSIYLAPEAKGQGIGRQLLETLIAQSTALGFRQLVAVIGDGHPGSASVRLHERLGFRAAGTLTGSGYKHGRWLNTVFMQLEMNGGAGIPPDPQSLPERNFRRAGS
jgi:L-amino acid N-acyltransferase YncA